MRRDAMTLRLPQETKEDLRKLADLQHLSMSDYVGMLIRKEAARKFK